MQTQSFQGGLLRFYNLILLIINLIAFILPGPLAIELLSKYKRKTIATSLIEKLLLGFVIWIFVLTAPVIILSMLGLDFRVYYIFFVSISLFTVSFWLLVNSLRLRSMIKHVGQQILAIARELRYYHFLILLILILLLTIYHPTFIEWDATSDYLPSAKSLALTGNLYNVYRLSNYSFLNGFPTQIIYSYAYYFNDLTFLRLLPFVFFIMTLISLYIFARETKILKNPLIAICVLCTFPITWKLLAENSLYLEIPFTFYTMASFLLCFRVYKKPTTINYVLLGISLFGLALSKELGVFMAAFFFATIIALLFKRHSWFSKSLFIMIFTLPFNVLFFIDIMSGNGLGLLAVIREVIVVAFSFVIILFSRKTLSNEVQQVSQEPQQASFVSKFIVIVVFVFALALYTARNFLLLGSFTYTSGPAYGNFARFAPALNLGPVWNNIVGMVSFYTLLTSSGFVSIFLVFFVIGLWTILKRRNSPNNASSFLFAAFVFLLLVWSTILYSASSATDYRRLFYFAPFASIIIALGFERLFQKYEHRIADVFVLFNSFLILVLVIVFYQFLDIWVLFWRLDTFVTVSFVSLFAGIVVVLPFLALLLGHDPFKMNRLLIRAKPAIIRLAILQLVLAIVLLSPILVYVNQNGYDPNVYYRMQGPSDFAFGIFDVVNYLNEQNNNYGVISLFGPFIPFFTNRTCIELNGHEGYLTLKSLLGQENYLNSLQSNRIKYVLIPSDGVPVNVEYLKNQYISDFPNFRNLLYEQSALIKKFQYYTLYEIIY